jgi:hypothetical protein
MPTLKKNSLKEFIDTPVTSISKTFNNAIAYKNSILRTTATKVLKSV